MAFQENPWNGTNKNCLHGTELDVLNRNAPIPGMGN